MNGLKEKWEEIKWKGKRNVVFWKSREKGREKEGGNRMVERGRIKGKESGKEWKKENLKANSESTVRNYVFIQFFFLFKNPARKRKQNRPTGSES